MKAKLRGKFQAQYANLITDEIIVLAFLLKWRDVQSCRVVVALIYPGSPSPMLEVQLHFEQRDFRISENPANTFHGAPMRALRRHGPKAARTLVHPRHKLASLHPINPSGT